MVLDLRRLFVTDGASLNVETAFDFSNTELYGGYPLKKPVVVKGKVFNRAGIVTLDVVCYAEYSADCDRCGTLTVKQYEIPIKRVLVNKLYNGENDEMLLLDDYKIDLRELCFTEVVLGLPTKHLCKDDCKGICPHCYKNLNEGECGCGGHEIDPRLEILTQLLNK